MLLQSKSTSKLYKDYKSNYNNKEKGKVKSHGQSKSKENVSGGYPKAGHAQKLTSTCNFPKLLDEKYKHYKKEGLCFICRKPGYDLKMCRFNPNHTSRNDLKS